MPASWSRPGQECGRWECCKEWAGDEQGTRRDGLATKSRQRKGASPREKVWVERVPGTRKAGGLQGRVLCGLYKPIPQADRASLGSAEAGALGKLP